MGDMSSLQGLPVGDTAPPAAARRLPVGDVPAVEGLPVWDTAPPAAAQGLPF